MLASSLKPPDQRPHPETQRLGDLHQHVNRSRLFAPLQFADVVVVQVGQFSQFLLADLPSIPMLADGPPQHLAMFPLHRLQRNQVCLLPTTVDRL